MSRLNLSLRPRHFALPLAILTSALVFTPSAAQPLEKYQRERGLQMLHDVADALRKHYYDPSYHGIDMTAKIKSAEQNIQNANSNSQVFGAIAEVLDNLDDSHTFFEPPSRSARREFGYVLTIVGDDCYITNVRPRTDASEKLSPGDRVTALQAYAPARANL